MDGLQTIVSSEDGDPVLAGLENSVACLRRLADLEVAGRTMMTFMRGHMDEVAELMDVGDYMARFYDDHAKEYLQRDEYDFVVHHCLRTLYRPWTEELERLQNGPLGEVLGEVDAEIPVPGPPVREGREPVAEEWFDDVSNALRDGQIPDRPGPVNPVMPGSDCRLQDEPGLIRGQFVIWCGEVWARGIPIVWDLVREGIAMRRLVEDEMSRSEIAQAVDAHSDDYCRATTEFAALLNQWRTFHEETVNVHDPMYRTYVEPLYGWVESHKPALADWQIKDDTKFELYLEVATTLAALRGKSLPVDLPEFEYWRAVPWNPTVINWGVRGLPPFETVQPDHQVVATSQQVRTGPAESATSPLFTAIDLP